MSVLIKGMEMPKDCFECLFFDEEHNWCDMQDEHLHNQKDKAGRAKWCPLVEVEDMGGNTMSSLNDDSNKSMNNVLHVTSEPFVMCQITYCEICGGQISNPLMGPQRHICDRCKDRLLKLIEAED